MSEKAETIDQFLAMLRAKNCNKVSGDADLERLFGKDAPFAVVCNKCGSMDVEILGEHGIDYGATGFTSIDITIMCNGCGVVATAWN